MALVASFETAAPKLSRILKTFVGCFCVYGFNRTHPGPKPGGAETLEHMDIEQDQGHLRLSDSLEKQPCSKVPQRIAPWIIEGEIELDATT